MGIFPRRMIAQAIALDHEERERRLILLSAVVGRTPEERERVQPRLRTLQEQGVGPILGGNQGRWFTPEFIARNPELVARRMRQLQENRWAVLRCRQHGFLDVRPC